MNANYLNDLFLGSGDERPGKYQDAVFSLQVWPDEEREGHYVLHFHSPEKGIVNLLLFNEDNIVCLQKERRCKAGLNVYRLNLSRYAEGRYRAGILSEERSATAALVI